MNGETNMMDECLESSTLLYTFIILLLLGLYIAFTSVSTQTRLNYTTIRQLLLLSSSRRAVQSASGLFFTVPT